MPTHDAAIKWNNQWWDQAVHRKKTALPKTKNVRPSARKDSPVADVSTLDTNNVLPPTPFKTTTEAELKNARQALEKILTAATVMKSTVEIEFVDSTTLAAAQANVQAIVDEFYRNVLSAVRATK